MDAAARLDALWGYLHHACVQREHAFRNPTLCTHDATGAHGRVVVLRHVDAVNRTLRFYTDTRSSKMRQLGRSEAVFWDPGDQVQARLCGVLTVVAPESSAVEAAWQGITMHGRQNYRGVQPPGTPLQAAEHCATLISSADGRSTFAVLSLQVEEVDGLWLPSKHRLHATRTTGWRAQWVQL